MHFRLSHRWPGVAAVALALSIGAVVAQDTPQPEKAELDRPVKDFTVKDILSGKDVSLSQFKGKPVVLSFISYTCGTSWRYEQRMGKMIAEYGGKDKGVVFLNVNSNANNTEEGMKKYVEARNLDMIPLLKDTGNRVADYFGTRVTPTFYVLDKDHVLRYRGSFDDSPMEERATKQFVRPAVDAVLASNPVTVKENRPFG
jgi:cytochrome oxidase Cu insertion factor (SCO1/SenC/PrrC family)